MEKRHTRAATRSLLVIAGLMGWSLLPTAQADPPDHAPAHGWRRNHDQERNHDQDRKERRREHRDEDRRNEDRRNHPATSRRNWSPDWSQQNRDRNHNGVPDWRDPKPRPADWRTVDRNRNGVPDWKEQDRNRDRDRDGIPDWRDRQPTVAQDLDHDGYPDRRDRYPRDRHRH